MAQAPSLEITISALFNRLRSTLSQALAEAGLPMSPPQTQLLNLIAEQPGTNAGSLARTTGRDKAAVTRLLAPLLEQGWLIRTTDPQDGRRQMLTLSEAGAAIQAKALMARHNAHEQVFSRLSDKEKKQLNALLGQCIGEP